MSTRLDIQTLYDALRKKLGLQWTSGEQHGTSIIHESTDNTPDLSLAGGITNTKKIAALAIVLVGILPVILISHNIRRLGTASE